MQTQPIVKTFAEVVKMNLRPKYLVVSDNSDSDKNSTEDDSSDHSNVDITARNTGSTKTDEATELDPGFCAWNVLPYNFLVSVCRYLHDRDRYQMACVCRSWRDATQNPSLWRRHVFYLYCRHEVPQGLVWLSARARHLRHATIMCFGNFDRRREDFLKALQPADLFDLDINGAAYWWSASEGNATCSRVVARIVRLLKTQRRLRGFQMRQAMLPFNTGMGVLSALLVASGSTLTRLGLEDFFGEQISMHLQAMPDKFTTLVSQFHSLNELTINYEYLTDGLLRWLAWDGEDRTINLNVVSWLSSSNRPGVSKAAWADLAASSRDVRVYLILQNIRSISEVRFSILRPEIPMHRLDLVGVAALRHDDNEDMADLLRHIASSYGKTLAGLRLWSDNFMCQEIEDAILLLLRKSPKLTYLDLHMEVRCQMIAVLCEMQRTQVIQLNTLRLARSLTNFLEFEQFREQVRACYPVLKNLGLDFHVRAESAPDHSARNEYVFIIADNAGVMDSEDDSYIASLTASTELTNAAKAVMVTTTTTTTATTTTVSTASVSSNNQNNSNVIDVIARNSVSNGNDTIDDAVTVGGGVDAGITDRRHRNRYRQPPAMDGSAHVPISSNSQRFRFEWRQYRLRRQLRSRSRRFRGLN